ncbi:unnamed protein product [Penicillium salamii]|nr:unnamed protein product [Penicillium salamii]CAG8409873.1 unnamed protein product [Penicillium salamii]
MLPLKSLLNPEPERQSRGTPPPASSAKPRKMPKDALVYVRGKIQGQCRFPPCEERDEGLAKAHREFRLQPLGNIADYPRQIPYASDKKTFQQRTGRDSFHVFQYNFQIPGEEKVWHVMWDYNIGIVRITHLFKCNGYAKTTPGKMLAQNNGLREICHSITGGALAAQGYWMPYDAAKALAATFCWKIRHVLTPLFGTDFPAMCVHPDERRRHGVMVIDPEIIRAATEQANYFRSLEMPSSPRSVPAPVKSYPLLRGLEAFGPSLKLPPLKCPRHRYTDSIASARDSSTEPYSLSPKSQSPCSTFTPINPPRSINAPPPSHVASPKTLLRAISDAIHKDKESGAMSADSDTDSDGSSNVFSTPNCPSLDEEKMNLDGPSDIETRESDSDFTDSDEDWAVYDDSDKDYRGPPTSSSSVLPKGKAMSTSPGTPTKKNPKRKSRECHFANEVRAAEALLRLQNIDFIDSEAEAEAEIDDKDMHTNIESRPRVGSSRGGKRRRASL